jgi:hypothetical protein
MDRLDGVVLLASVCVLLVVVSGAVESGKVAGFNYSGGFSIVKSLFAYFGGNSTIVAPGNTTISTRGTFTKTSLTLTNASTLPNWTPYPPVFSPYLSFLTVLPAWSLAAIATACFGGALLLILRLRTSIHVVDLESTLREMEQQTRYLEETWSYKLRNAALLRHYLLMRRACLKVGLRDEPAETPQEYVGRVSSFFDVEKSEATKFASAVNRSRYGEELSEPEVGEASKFMGAFADLIRRRAGEVQ